MATPKFNLTPLPPDPTPHTIGAACKGMFDLFGSESLSSAKAAKQICAECPVQNACLQWALDNKPTFGVWGGKDFTKRQPGGRRKKVAA